MKKSNVEKKHTDRDVMQEKKNSIAKNYIYNLLYQLLTIFLPLITTPYLSRILGAKQIGIYGYTTSIIAYFILFGSLGIAMYGQREIAYYQDNKKKRSQIFWELVIIRFVTLFISTFLYYFIYVKGDEYSIYYFILLIQLIATMFDISWFFQGIEEFDKTVIRNLIVKVLCLVLIFTVVKSYGDLWKYFLIYAGAEFIGNLSIWLYVPKYIEKVKFKCLNFKNHIKPTLALFVPQIAIQIYTVLDKTMIGAITNDMAEVGLYEQAQKVVRAGVIIVGALQIVMNSRIANAYAKKDKKEIHLCLEKSFKFVWLFAVPMMFGLIGVAAKFVPWYYGKGFEGVTNILIFTSPILVFIGLNGITGVQYLVQIGKQKVFTKSVVFGCLINVLCNLLLINKFGGVGAAIASCLAEFAVFLYQAMYFREEFTIPEIFKLSIKNMISGVIMLVVILTLAHFLSVSIWNTLIEIVVGGLVYICLLLLMKDQFIKDLIQQVYLGVSSKFKRS